MKRVTIAAAAAVAAGNVFLYGCAARPERIAPSYVSTLMYSNLSCQQLGEEDARVSSAYVIAAGQQNHARKNDTVGVLLLGLPIGSMTGKNVAPQIASLKGQANAIHEVEMQKNCNDAQPIPADTHPYLSQPASRSSGS